MSSSGMSRHVALVRTDVSEELSASIIRVTRIGELGTLAITSVCQLLVMANAVPTSRILVAMMMEALSS
jgi:demethoxyubiquinone hydroxylase (CLK1/Coq7/Cat5 family)